jgi:hypothetical protein
MEQENGTSVKFFIVPSCFTLTNVTLPLTILKTTLNWPSIVLTLSLDRCLELKPNRGHEGYVYVKPIWRLLWEYVDIIMGPIYVGVGFPIFIGTPNDVRERLWNKTSQTWENHKEEEEEEEVLNNRLMHLY